MLIRVIYVDGTHDSVSVFQLDRLIVSGRIKKFLRSAGWVDIDRDPIRLSARLYEVYAR